MSDLLSEVRAAMQSGRARLEVVRLFFNETHPWGIVVYKHSTTPKGRDKWTKVTLVVPRDDQTQADVLHMLGEMVDSDDEQPEGGAA